MSTYAQSVDASKIAGTFSVFNWHPVPGLRWMQNNWHLSVYISFLYALVIFYLKRKMKFRQSFNLRKCLAFWNIMLSVFSCFGAYFMFPEMMTVFTGSFYHSVCYSSIIERSQYWMWLFALSKVVELGDTLFIVLRKQNLIFLHWSHHIISLIYTWYSCAQNISLGRWFVTMNYFVHSLMYGYYACRAFQCKIPRYAAICITTLQIIQMVLGFYVSFYAFEAKLRGVYCEIPMKTATIGITMYIAFFYMFAQFFVQTYLPSLKGAKQCSPSATRSNGHCKHASKMIVIANETDWTTFVGLSYTLSVEENFDWEYARNWHDRYWYICLVLSFVYVALIYSGQEYMKTRKPFKLRKTLAAWNSFLSIFAFCGTIRLLPELVHTLFTKGFYGSICSNSFVKDVRIQFWLWLFTWSKVIELGDTLFIVLRKQKLIALHWIHHTLTLFSCFFAFGEMAASARWLATMNYLVHSYMYLYYALKALQIKIPRFVSMIITCSQMLQMIIGLIVNYSTNRIKSLGMSCDVSLNATRIGVSIYVIFFCLFLNFFVTAYISKPEHVTVNISVTQNSKKCS
ncbi:elongation of very long chain fatty acids protein 6-like protein [Leptotrombidium deliense]|uniref:Elongation of very long chain fatty acids protein n=1 Tax=Leptotrombidium deliense TaxID=299467 RepID=A0A443SSN4_9ACAR|nr:elongation of very long chain fatty acids protein 6-like protein [Leptotrombidium deliense]